LQGFFSGYKAGNVPRLKPPTLMPIAMSIQLSEEKGGVGGHLVPLKTALETRARDTLADFHVSTVPVKQANTILKHVNYLNRTPSKS